MRSTAPDPSAKPGFPEPIDEITVLWLTAGLGCDGDTIAMTGATQPSIEDVVLGGLPWIPKVKFHNPFLAYENGDEFVAAFRNAAAGKITAYIFSGCAAPSAESHHPKSYKAKNSKSPRWSFLNEC